VLLQGLTINGGQTGVDILQPSSSVPLSVTIDHCTITNMTASNTASGIVVENGGDVDVTYSTISGASSTGVVAFGGTYLTISNSKIQSNGSDGLAALDSNVQMINSTSSSNIGAGVFLGNCSGTLTGNTFAGNTGIANTTTYGDAVQIGDGAMTVTGNTFDSNSDAGVWLFAGTTASSGPTATLRKNIMRSNGIGVLIDQAQNAQLDGNLVEDNALGLFVFGATPALLTNNIVVRSTDTTAGDGIAAGDSSTATLVNNTVYQNQHNGISFSGTATISVINSIISGNRSGDLQGLHVGNVQFSLIGDGTFALSNHNISGDPMFVNPAADDFDLSSGSPALDAGSNAAANLPFLDYNGQLRVASASSMPGDGTVDMGAAEAGSAYPLIYPLLINGLNSTLGDTLTTGFAALNPSTSTTTAALFSAYDQTGALLSGLSNPASRSFAPETQVPIIGFQLFGFPFQAPEVGTVLATSAQKLTGFFLVFDQAFSRMADGVDVSAETGTNLFLMRHESDASGKAIYSIFNPGVNPASVTATPLNPAGTPVDAPKQSVIAPKGQFLFTFDAVTASSGYVRVQSDRPVAGLEMYGNTAEIAALRPALPGSEARLFFPHIAVNQGYSSLIGVVNTSSSPANLTLAAYGNDGNTLGSPATRSLSGNGQLLESATGLFGLPAGNLLTGYVVVESDQPGITGFCAFNYDNGAVQSNAAVPSESIAQQKLFFSHVAHQVPAGSGGNYQTGIALLNPFGTTVPYTMRVFDGEGNEVAEMTDALGPHAKVARLLSHPTAGAGFFTQPISLGSGHIEVTADYPLLGFELFFTEQLTQLASVPAQTAN
jgi:parallel beta-helix repeat protein